MKIRIRGASVRMRLSKSEVADLMKEGRVEEVTPFAEGILRYAVQRQQGGGDLSASFVGNEICLKVPELLIKDWDINDLVSISAQMPLKEGNLFLLLEKDFQCIDQTDEDQSDNYTNPKQNC